MEWAWPSLAGRGGVGDGAPARAGKAAAAGGRDAAGIAVGSERIAGGSRAAGRRESGVEPANSMAPAASL